VRIVASAVLVCTSALVHGYSPEDASREERFANPPASSRLMPIYHGWSNDAGAQAEGIDRLQRRGYGGFVGNVSFDNGYLDNRANIDGFKNLVSAAKARGLRLWLYDEAGYPSGTAGGRITVDHPERTAKGYLFASTDASAGETVALTLPPGRLVGVAAWPTEAGRLSGNRLPVAHTQGLTNLTWTAPKDGSAVWKLIAWSVGDLFAGTHAAVNLSNKIPYINLLSKEATEAFLASTHEVYSREFGGNLSAFDSLFTDEPSLMSLWMRPQPWGVLPAAADLTVLWKKRTGRDLDADAPVLAFGASERFENTRALRYAFWDLVGQLISANFMRRIDAWAQRHGSRGGGHLLLEEWTGVHLPVYGDFFRCLRALGNPGVDMLTSLPQEVSPQTAKLAGSAGALNHAKRVMCEVSDHVQRTQSSSVRQVTADEIAGTLNLLMWGGVNTFTSYYDMRAFTDEQISRINLRLGRANTILSEGVEAADVALLYPADTMKTDYDARPQPWCEVYGQAFQAICSMQTVVKSLSEGNRAWMFTDAASLGCGEFPWQVIVLPGVDTIPLEAMRNLHSFWKSGGLVVAFGAVPVNSAQDFPSVEVSALTQEMFGGIRVPEEGLARSNPAGGLALAYPASRSKEIAQIIARHLEPPVAAEGEGKVFALRTSHRRTSHGDIYFIVNHSPVAWRGRLRLCGGGTAERWDPQLGTHCTHVVDACGWGAVDIPAYGAVLFTTVAQANTRRIEAKSSFVPKTKQ